MVSEAVALHTRRFESGKVLQKRANHIAAVRINVLRILYRAARLCSPLVLKVMDLISFSHNNEHDTPV
jgi:hypothetical protein